MNKKSLFALSLSATLLASCGSDDVITPANGGGDAAGKAYVALSISLPTTTGSSRAANGDDGNHIGYDTGEANEYNVEDLTIVYFTEDGNDYKVNEVWNVDKNQLTWAPPTSASGITTYATLPVHQVDKDVCRALVILNQPANLTITKGQMFSDINNELTVNDVKAFTTANGQANHFFMSNSPLSDGTVLVNVEPDTRKEYAEAHAKPVYVERAVGKVSMTKPFNQASWTYAVDGSASGFTGDEVVFQAWALDVTNTKTYPVRKYDATWSLWNTNSNAYSINRFVSLSTSLIGNEGTAYRTYWATDPNYDNTNLSYEGGNLVTTNGDAADFVYLSNLSGTDAEKVKNGMDASAYCLENTFDVNHMKQGETTRVIVKAKYTPKSNWDTDIAANNQNVDESGTWYTLGYSGKVNNKASLEAKIAKAVQEVSEPVNTVSVTVKESALTAGEQEFAKAMFTVTKTPATGTATTGEATDAELANVKARLGKLTVYKGGECYYVARIKHFGDSFTPWTANDDYISNANDETRQKFLGRYGIVRNNWYQLTIESVTAPGTPVIPAIPDAADDEQSYYLQTTVHIMDWAVRTQGLKF